MIHLRHFKTQDTAFVQAVWFSGRAANQHRRDLQRELNNLLREWFNLMALWLARWVKEHEAEIAEQARNTHTEETKQ